MPTRRWLLPLKLLLPRVQPPQVLSARMRCTRSNSALFFSLVSVRVNRQATSASSRRFFHASHKPSSGTRAQVSRTTSQAWPAPPCGLPSSPMVCSGSQREAGSLSSVR